MSRESIKVGDTAWPAELGPVAVWIVCAAAAVAVVFVVVFLVYLGCALVAIWRCRDRSSRRSATGRSVTWCRCIGTCWGRFGGGAGERHVPGPAASTAGRPPACPPELLAYVVELRRRGLSYGKISEVLNAEGVPTPDGRPVWQRSYVDRLLHTRHARDQTITCDDRHRAGAPAGPSE